MSSIFLLLLLCSPILCMNDRAESTHQPHGALYPLNITMQLYHQQEVILNETISCTPNAEENYDIHQSASIKILSTNDRWHPRVTLRKITPANHSSAIMVEYSVYNPNENIPVNITSNPSIFLNIPYTKALTSNTTFSLLVTHASIHH